jgi:hypothetical protein
MSWAETVAAGQAVYPPPDRRIGLLRFWAVFGVVVLGTVALLSLLSLSVPSDPGPEPGGEAELAFQHWVAAGLVVACPLIAFAWWFGLERVRKSRLSRLRFVPAPGWPPTPEGWTPRPGWSPDPTWPAAPEAWNFWQSTR